MGAKKQMKKAHSKWKPCKWEDYYKAKEVISKNGKLIEQVTINEQGYMFTFHYDKTNPFGIG